MKKRKSDAQLTEIPIFPGATADRQAENAQLALLLEERKDENINRSSASKDVEMAYQDDSSILAELKRQEPNNNIEGYGFS